MEEPGNAQSKGEERTMKDRGGKNKDVFKERERVRDKDRQTDRQPDSEGRTRQ